MTIDLSPTFSMPDEAVTQTFGILAKRGAGKSNTAAVMAEEMFAAQLSFVVIDPVGAWWGLRSSGTGKSPGLEIPIFGGYRGDVPLERNGAELVADLVVDESLSCVLDVSAFESERAKREFLTAFAERLFRRKGQPGKGTPLHLFLEEADDYAPQRSMGIEMNRCLGAFQRIVKQGRARGLGSTMISQRSASLNKDLLTQIETLIVLRTTSPQDRKAISAWVEYHGESEELLSSLSELDDGEAWVWSPWLRVVKRVKVRRRRTFDSGSTPSLKSARAPATLADIDIPAITERMAATVERAKATDPKELQRRIAELEREVRARPEPEQKVETIEVPVFKDGEVGRLEAVVGKLSDVGADLQVVAREIGEMLGRAANRPAPVIPAPRSQAAPRPAPAPRAARTATAVSSDLSKAERAILVALARYPHGKAKRHLGQLAGYAWSGGGFNNALSSLNVKGLIQRGDPIRITEEGMAAIAGEVDDLPAPGPALVAYWAGQVGKAERLILERLAQVYPKALTKEQLGEDTGYEPSGGGFNNAVSRLRVLELVEGRGELRASDALMIG